MLLLSMWRFLNWTVVVPGADGSGPGSSRLGPAGGLAGSDPELASGSVNGTGDAAAGGQEAAGAAPAARGMRRRWLPRMWRRAGAAEQPSS